MEIEFTDKAGNKANNHPTDCTTDRKQRYSVPAVIDVAAVLIDNSVAFVHQRDCHNRMMRFYFTAIEEIADLIEEQTGWFVVDETDDWGFDQWEQLEK